MNKSINDKRIFNITWNFSYIASAVAKLMPVALAGSMVLVMGLGHECALDTALPIRAGSGSERGEERAQPTKLASRAVLYSRCEGLLFISADLESPMR